MRDDDGGQSADATGADASDSSGKSCALICTAVAAAAAVVVAAAAVVVAAQHSCGACRLSHDAAAALKCVAACFRSVHGDGQWSAARANNKFGKQPAVGGDARRRSHAQLIFAHVNLLPSGLRAFCARSRRLPCAICASEKQFGL